MKTFWVSRDNGNETDDAVMITAKKPEVDRTPCETCGQGNSVRYTAPSGIEFGADGEICYDGWLKLTGIVIEKGECFKVRIERDE